jgi:prolyl 4-hydroxylase
VERLSQRTDNGVAALKRGGVDAASLAHAAFTAGSAADEVEAYRWLALLAAAGVDMAQDWEKALDYLEKAASRGSASALGQLAALASEHPPGAPSSVRVQIDLTALLATPAKRVVNAQPRIVAIEDFVSRGEADWLIGLARGRLQRAQVFQGAQAAETRGRTNTASRFDFTDSDVVVLLTRQKIAAAIGVPVGALETSQILHYETGEEFAAHFDWLDPMDVGQALEIARDGQRIATFLLYLNDDFEGGATSFPRLGLSHRGRAGDALYFANIQADGSPDQRTLHVGTAPSSSQKWVFSQWVRNQARV